jgi:asparagine synthetase B (glutamine-hydrolysing)
MRHGRKLSRLEVACGLVFGEDVDASRLPTPAAGGPREALESAVVPALERPPCLVSFSGGRDSAAVLAVATHVARREGLELPVPATNWFPDAAQSDESEWQELVIRHLELDDWQRVAFTDELDCVGPVARATLSRHGLLWPFNAYFHLPLLQRAAGGSLLTGAGGDEAFSTSTFARTQSLLAGAARPQPRDVLRVGFALAPARIRARVLRRRIPEAFRWLQDNARRAVERAAAEEAAAEPLRWGRRLQWLRRLRHMEVSLDSLRVLADGEEVAIHHPLADGVFWAELAALPRSDRFRSRTDAMRRFFGGLLPEPVLVRTTKASFDEAFWNRHSRALAASWEGEGVDAELVDVDALRREWASPAPNPRSYLLLQAAWLERSRGTAPDEVEQQLGGSIERVPVAGSPELPRR